MGTQAFTHKPGACESAVNMQGTVHNEWSAEMLNKVPWQFYLNCEVKIYKPCMEEKMYIYQRRTKLLSDHDGENAVRTEN